MEQHKKHWGKAVLLITASSLALATVAGAEIQQPVVRQEQVINLPAGSLSDRLIDLGDALGVNIFAADTLVAGKTARAISGTMEPQQAIEVLLAGSDLTVRKVSPSAFEIVQRVSEADPVSGGGETVRDEPVLVMERLVVTGRRAPRSISAIPNSITVIDEVELTNQFTIDEDLSSLLQFSVPGFAAPGSSSRTPAVLRGRTALILIDGVPQNQLIRSAGNDIETLAPEAIARVEVLRGANAVFGFGATGGVVNFITKRAPKEDGYEVIAKARTEFQTSQVEPSKEIYAQVSARKGRVGLVFGGGFDDREPLFDGDGNLLSNENNLEAGRDIRNFHGAFDIDIADGHRIRATANFYKRENVIGDFAAVETLGVPPDEFATAFFPESLFTDLDAIYYGADPVDLSTLPFDIPDAEDTFTNASLTYETDDVFGSSVQVTGLYHEYDNNFSAAVFDGVFFRDLRERKRLGVRGNIDTPLDFVVEGARLVWGADHISETIDLAFVTFDPVTGDATLPTRTTGRDAPFIEQDTTGLWGNVEIPIGPFLISGGVRQDWIDATLDDASDPVFGGENFFTGGNLDYTSTLYNAGIVYYAAPELDVYFSFSQGFDITDIGRAAFQVPSADLIDPAPAVTDSFELGFRTRIGELAASVAGFFSDSELASRTRPNPMAGGLALPLRQPEQIWGVEASWTYEASDAVDLGGTFTWMDGETETDDGTTTPIQNRFIPPVTFTAHGEWSPTPWFDGRVQLVQTFGDNRFSDADRDEFGSFGRGNFEDLTLVDALFRVKSKDYGTFALGIENVFDVVDAAPQDRVGNQGITFFPLPGRTISLTYTYSFSR